LLISVAVLPIRNRRSDAPAPVVEGVCASVLGVPDRHIGDGPDPSPHAHSGQAVTFFVTRFPKP